MSARPRQRLARTVSSKRKLSSNTTAIDGRSCLSADAADVRPVEAHRSLLGVVEPREQSKQGGFAAPGRADEGDDLAAPERQVEAFKGGRRLTRG